MDRPQERQRPQPHRADDTGAGIPQSEGLENARLLDEAEVAEDRQRDEQKRKDAAERFLQDQATTLQIPRGLVRVALATAVVAASLTGLLVLGQVASLIVDVGNMSAPWNWILGTVAALFLATILWVASKLALLLVRLQRNPAVDLAALQALRERRAWQRLAIEHTESAETEIREYLGSYKLDAKARTSLLAAGMEAREFDALTEAKQHLLDEDLHLPPTDWLQEFSVRFQAGLDTVAERQTKSYGLRAAVGTALSPLPLLDQAVVLYSSLKLIRDLLVLYNLRPTIGHTVIVLTHATVQTYLGGVAQNVTEAGTEAAWREIVGPPEELLGASVAGVAAKATAKFAEGAANGLLVWRLGRRTTTFIQPVRHAG